MSSQCQRRRLRSIVVGSLASAALSGIACGSDQGTTGGSAAAGASNQAGNAAQTGAQQAGGGNGGAGRGTAGAAAISGAGGGASPAGAGGSLAGANSGSASNAGAGGVSSAGAGGASNAGASPGGASGALMPQTFILYDDSNGRLMYVNDANPSASWTVNSGAGRDLQLIGGGRVLFGKSDGWDEYQLSDGAKVAGQHGFPGTEDAYRLANGNTVLASVSGTNIVLKQITAAGQAQAPITYPGYSYVRLVRPTSTGTYLVTSDTVVFEGNDQGAVLWHVNPVGAKHAWKAMRLANGNTAITTGYGATLVIYDSAGKLLQTIGGTTAANMPVGPWFYADFHILASGNYFLVNSQADRTFDSSIQLLQYDSAGTLVWKKKQPSGVRTLEAAIILDGLDTSKLYVEPQGVLIPTP